MPWKDRDYREAASNLRRLTEAGIIENPKIIGDIA
jgi:hypothetical protein